jgi:hypothetical protein
MISAIISDQSRIGMEVDDEAYFDQLRPTISTLRLSLNDIGLLWLNQHRTKRTFPNLVAYNRGESRATSVYSLESRNVVVRHIPVRAEGFDSAQRIRNRNHRIPGIHRGCCDPFTRSVHLTVQRWPLYAQMA